MTASRLTAGRPPRHLWPDTHFLGSLSRSRTRSDLVTSAASTHVAQDQSPEVRDVPLPLHAGPNLGSPGQPVPKLADDNIPLHSTAGPHTTSGRTPASWDRCPRATRGWTQTPVWLAHTSPKAGAQGLGTVGSLASGWRQPVAREGQLQLHMGQNPRSSGRPVPEPADDILLLPDTAGPTLPISGHPGPGMAIPEPPEVGP